MKSVGIILVFVIAGIVLVVGVYAGIAWLASSLYSSLAPTEWVRPTFLQWIGIVFLVTIVLGRGTKVVRG